MNRLQQVEASILATREHCKDKQWLQWAESWLDNSDRSAKSAFKAYRKTDKAYYAGGEIGLVDPNGDCDQAVRLVAQATTNSAYIAYWQAAYSEGRLDNSEEETDSAIVEIGALVTEALQVAGRLMAKEKALTESGDMI